MMPARHRPRRGAGLIFALVTASGAVVPGAPPAAAATTMAPVADATVAADSADTNFGTAATLEADQSALLEAFLAFDVPDPGGSVSRVTLRLFVVNPSANAPKVYRAAASWSETALTWDTRPARQELLSDRGSVSAGHWVEYDVTGAVSRPGPVGFGLVADSTDGTDFNSRDAAANRPELVVEVAGPPPPPPPAGVGDVATLAGTTKGFAGDGGPAMAARLNLPRTMASDGAGNVYIVDTYNHRIRRVDTAGMITTVGGTGSAGYGGDGGPATRARFDTPHGIAADRAGNLYVADPPNQRVRRIDAATGIVTTVAGTGTSGFGGDGGPATEARLRYPKGVEIAPDGSLYVADNNNHRIRRVDLRTGIITTVAGTGSAGFSGDGGFATAARLNEPRNTGFDALGRLYIVDQDNRRIRRVDLDGRIYTFASGFTMPRDVAVDRHGNLYVADEDADRIRRVDPNGFVTTFAGTGSGGLSGDGGPAGLARLNNPLGVAYDAATDTVLIGDTANHRIRAVRLSE